MKTSALLGMVAAAVACAVLIGSQPSRSPAQPKEPKAAAPTKWEYKQADSLGDAALTKLGEEGWELVTVVGGQPFVEESKSTTVKANLPGKADETTTKNTIGYGKLVYFLKRPK